MSSALGEILPEIPQKQGTDLQIVESAVGWKRPPVHSQFKPGQSGNPGGLPKGTPRVTDAYRKLLTLSPAELASFVPANVAEAAALKQINATIAEHIRADVALPSLKEVTDRTEGKAPQTIQVNDVSELERLVIRVQERVLAQTGRELAHEVALEHVLAYRPDLAALR